MGWLIILLVLLAVALAAAFVIFLVVPLFVVIFRKSGTSEGKAELRLTCLPVSLMIVALFASLASWRFWDIGFPGWLTYCCPGFAVLLWIWAGMNLFAGARFRQIPHAAKSIALEYRLAFYEVRWFLNGFGRGS